MWFRFQLWLLAIIIRCLEKTWRYHFYGREFVEKISNNVDSPRSDSTYLLAIWHRFALPGITSHAHANLKPLVSHSKDGTLVTYVAEKFGIDCVRGSSSRGGPMALRQMLQVLKSGTIIAITVDGPRGPRGVVKPGIVDLAGLTKLPIIPLTVFPSRAWILSKAWDKTVIPKPFAQVHVAYGEALYISDRSEESRERYCGLLAVKLDELEKQTIHQVLKIT